MNFCHVTRKVIRMPTPQLSLDSFVFEGLEIPDKIVIKNKQRFAVHHTGRGCAVDSMGEDCQSISFRGAFTGLEAANRSKGIDLLRAQGMPLLLTWESQTVFVVVKEFELSHKSVQWIDYQILCLIVQTNFSASIGSEDILNVSYYSQIEEALTLLRGTDMESTPSQIVALNTLSQMNYDTPPEGEVQVVQQFLASMDQVLVSLDGRLMMGAAEQKYYKNVSTKSMSEWFNDIEKRAILTLARNRFMDIFVKSTNTNR